MSDVWVERTGLFRDGFSVNVYTTDYLRAHALVPLPLSHFFRRTVAHRVRYCPQIPVELHAKRCMSR